MSDEITLCVESMKEEMQNAFLYLEKELDKIRAGKANVKMLDTVKVDYYGTPTPLAQVASLSTPDPKQIVIQPWEKSMIGPIEKAILAANLGVTPQTDGRVLRITIPELNEERRKEIVKVAKKQAEDQKIVMRNVRRDANEAVKKLEKDKKITEDERDQGLEKIQKATDDGIAKIDAELKTKEAEVMAV